MAGRTHERALSTGAKEGEQSAVSPLHAADANEPNNARRAAFISVLRIRANALM